VSPTRAAVPLHPGKPDVKRITYFLTAQTPTELTTHFYQAVNDFGPTHPDQVWGFEEFMRTADQKSGRVVYAATMGYGPGFRVTYDIRYKSTSVIIATITPATNQEDDQSFFRPIIKPDKE